MQVVDPVFLLNVDDWNLKNNIKLKEKYILVYDFDGSDLIKNIACDVSRRTGYKIYSINDKKLNYANINFTTEGPAEFVELVKNAEIIIANSFHAVAFSLIFEKEFVVINRKEAINTRMRDLLKDLECEDRLINELYSVDNILSKIDYSRINLILNKKIKESKEYLNLILKMNK